MPAPYDLSGIALLRTTFDQMLRNQRAESDFSSDFGPDFGGGGVKFSGGYQTWLSRELGWFKAILTPGGSLVATTTANIRLSMETLRVTFDVLTASAGTLATSVAIAAQSPPFTLAAGKTPASGAVSAGTQVIQDTNYNLDSLFTLKVVATQMVADAQNGVTNFGGGAQPNTFLAIFQPNILVDDTSGIPLVDDTTGAFLIGGPGPAQTTTMLVVRRYLAGARAAFDLLDQ